MNTPCRFLWNVNRICKRLCCIEMSTKDITRDAQILIEQEGKLIFLFTSSTGNTQLFLKLSVTQTKIEHKTWTYHVTMNL
jgi:hypothetical protein